jgi:excisionase family DNA binding protein
VYPFMVNNHVAQTDEQVRADKEIAVPPLLHRRINAAQRLSISVRLLDSLLAQRELKSVKVGRRRLVSEEAIQDFIRKREKSGD